MFSRTSETEVEYASKIKTILKQYGEGLLVDGAIASIESAEQLFSRVQMTLKTNSARKYRVVIRWYMDSLGFDISKLKMRMTESVTRSAKQKEYTPEAREYVLGLLDDFCWRNGDAKKFLRLHLIYGPLLGYRLSEVCTMNVESSDGSVVVKIKNGKNSNGRSNGDFRVLTIPGDFEGRSVFEDLASLIKLSSSDCIDSARRLHDILRLNIPKKMLKRGAIPTLTSTRHEYVLCSREVNDDVVTSASLGHLSAKTQKKHYGRHRKGRSKLPVSVLDFVGSLSVASENVKVVAAWLETNRNKITSRPRLMSLG